MDATYEFRLIIDRPIGDDEIDALFEAGCDDAAPEVDAALTMLHFTRRHTTLVAAIASAVVDVESSGLHVGGVGATDLVDLPEIAVRVGRTRESVRLLAAGRRGPGGFPSMRDGFYSWAAVRTWFARYDPDTVGRPDDAALAHDRVIAAADHVVRARTLMGSHAYDLVSLLSA